jgi:hypothetical protein
MQGEATGSTDLPPPQLDDLMRHAYSKLASNPGFIATFARLRGSQDYALASHGGKNSYTRSTAFLITSRGHHLPALQTFDCASLGKG